MKNINKILFNSMYILAGAGYIFTMGLSGGCQPNTQNSATVTPIEQKYYQESKQIYPQSEQTYNNTKEIYSKTQQKVSNYYYNMRQKSQQYSQKLTEQEIKDLIYLREEEKLARDVYLKMNELYKRRIFANIAKSEEVHTTAVKNVLKMYGIPDPVEKTGDKKGVFTNQELQNLYNKLVNRGKQSLVEALKVGAIIEEIDIADLEEKKKHTKNPVLLSLYDRLEKGSENHLRAFVANLRMLGVKYEPQYLSREKFNEIISNNPFKKRRNRRNW
jgi:hypothetical protein